MIIKVNESGYIPQPVLPSEYDFYFDFNLDSNYIEGEPIGWNIYEIGGTILKSELGGLLLWPNPKA